MMRRLGRFLGWLALGLALLVLAPPLAGQDRSRPRARELGIVPGLLPTGPLNAITDVPGVAVGQATLREGDSIRTGVTPRTHGSALFTRGETQALVVTTLGTGRDAQIIDALSGERKEPFMLHYNFPPFSVGETGMMGSPKRREIGHGNLARRGISAVMPDMANFPYVIRVVSEILESNGSSSMASVCGTSLALMDAGVPITKPVAGISIGLVQEGDRKELLTDIIGEEDHFGDMDFKVCGTRDGITAIQLDIKTEGLTHDIIRETLHRAKEARLKILDIMSQTLDGPRPEISKFAPRLLTLKIDPQKIGKVIGPGGKNIKALQESTGANIDIRSCAPVAKSEP